MRAVQLYNSQQCVIKCCEKRVMRSEPGTNPFLSSDEVCLCLLWSSLLSFCYLASCRGLDCRFGSLLKLENVSNSKLDLLARQNSWTGVVPSELSLMRVSDGVELSRAHCILITIWSVEADSLRASEEDCVRNTIQLANLRRPTLHWAILGR